MWKELNLRDSNYKLSLLKVETESAMFTNLSNEDKKKKELGKTIRIINHYLLYKIVKLCMQVRDRKSLKGALNI